MPVPFLMPKFDMDQERATIVAWAKKEGDPVNFEEAVLTVETDKVAIEVPAPATGTLAGILYHAGDVVPVTQVIAYILKVGETLADLPDGAPATAQPASSPTPAAQPPTAAPVAATPIAARIARVEGVDLMKVPATGNRITRQDVERYLAAQQASPRVVVAATPAARRLARERGIVLEAVTGSGPAGRVQVADVAAQAEPRPVGLAPERAAEVVEVSGIRRTIAERMQTSFQTIPYMVLTVDVDVTELERSRARLNQLEARRGAGKVSLTALLVKIVAWALAQHPYLNASWLEGKIYLWKDVNIGVATAVEGGLIVPVVHAADQRSVRQITEALDGLTRRARSGRLELRDVQHGTFTISNLGMYGVDQFRAIINPPESAILAVGRVVRRPVVLADREEVAVRPMMSLTLSADHRVLDGVVAARFLQQVTQAIEMPEVLLLY